MPCYLCCISSHAGIPIMCKKKGDIANLPFPIQAALNGAYVFGKSFDVRLLNVETASCQITWKEFLDSVTVILICERSVANANHVDRLTGLVWDAMVLCTGIDDLANITNVEKVKRQLKGCYRLVDRLLDGLEDGVETFCDLTGLPDVMLIPSSSKLQSALEVVTESADSTYGCLLVHGRLAAATRNWHQLTPRELSLLALYVGSARGSAAARDASVFLPVKSPHVPFRLLVCRLSEASEVCVLCGPSTVLEELEQEAVRQWAPVLDTVRLQEAAYPRALPASLTLDPAVQSFLLESVTSQRCAASWSPHGVAADRTAASPTAGSAAAGAAASGPAAGSAAGATAAGSAEARRRHLRSFQRVAAGTLLAGPVLSTDELAESSVEPREAYLVTGDYSGYTMRTAQYTIYVLFVRGTPPHVMQGLTQNMLHTLTTIKQVRF